MSNINNIIQKSIFEAFLSLRVFVLALLESYAFLTLRKGRKEARNFQEINAFLTYFVCIYFLCGRLGGLVMNALDS